jgi:hypothetical protein
MSEGEGDERVVFRYNRERRLERASEDVRKMYEEGYAPKKGILRGLTSNPGSRSVFFSILILCVAIVFLTLFGNRGDSASFDGASSTIKAFPYDGSTYVTFELSARDRPLGEPVPVTVALDCLDADGQSVSSGELDGVYSGKRLVLRTILPGDGAAIVRASVSFGSLKADMRAQVDRK